MSLRLVQGFGAQEGATDEHPVCRWLAGLLMAQSATDEERAEAKSCPGYGNGYCDGTAERHIVCTGENITRVDLTVSLVRPPVDAKYCVFGDFRMRLEQLH